MPTPFYARYIPPKKNAAPSLNVTQTIDNAPGESPKAKTIEWKKRKREADAGQRHEPKPQKMLLDARELGKQPVKDHDKPKKRKSERETNQTAESANKLAARKPEQRSNGDIVDEEVLRHVPNSRDVKQGEPAGLKRKERHKEREHNGSHFNVDRVAVTQSGAKDEESLKHKSILLKYQKSMKVSAQLPKPDVPEAEEPGVIVNDLQPFPQPEQPEEPPPTFQVLPNWLLNPIVVEPGSTASFEELRIDEAILKILKSKGYLNSTAIQRAVLPLLSPSENQHAGDLCVSATTGSGKTLAYVVPLIQSLKPLFMRKLQAIVVVPTRELVAQVHEVTEMCANGTNLIIKTATGTQSFQGEQDDLIEVGMRYDPDGYLKLQESLQDEETEPDDDLLKNDESIETFFNLLPGNVPAYNSKCDILICTPGRLVDHINSTKGFSLADLKWLIIDEADRLLDQSFQEWTSTLFSSIDTRPANQISGYLAKDPLVSALFTPWAPRHVRKVVLSATMTRDLDKLKTLRLSNPKLVIVTEAQSLSDERLTQGKPHSNEPLVMPSALQEWAIPVGDGSEKPLYILQFLKSTIFASEVVEKSQSNNSILKRLMPPKSDSDASSSGSSDVSSSELESDSDSSSDSISSSSSPSTSSSSSARSDANLDSGLSSDEEVPNHKHEAPSMTLAKTKCQDSQQRNVLIFVNSNESALRLAHLLSILQPSFSNRIRTLTKSSANRAETKTLLAFRAGKLSVLLATDRASRGLDIPALTDVVNYDMPRSVTSYVHRVGRTARAGAGGQSWAFYTESEARWFWNEIARASTIGRGNNVVKRTRLSLQGLGDGIKTRYREALAQLQRDVHNERA